MNATATTEDTRPFSWFRTLGSRGRRAFGGYGLDSFDYRTLPLVLAAITHLGKPGFGDPVDAEPGDVPVFWACGVTPQAALMAARPPFAITHTSGYMFVSDKLDSEFRVA